MDKISENKILKDNTVIAIVQTEGKVYVIIIISGDEQPFEYI